MFSSVKPMKRSYKYDLIIPLYDSINDNPTFGDISKHTDEELDEHFRNRIDVYAEKHPTLLVRQLAERLRKEWNKTEEPEPEPVAWMFPSDLKRFETQETTAVIYSVEIGSPTENSIPLYKESPNQKPLSDEWIKNNIHFAHRDVSFTELVRAVEKAHGIGGIR